MSLMMRVVRWLPFALIVILALWLRTRELDRRPMHADEANQAVKLGQLLDQGRYTFDPHDHHGPTLYYAAVPVAWLRRERSLATLTETTVRLVPALFGTVAVVLLITIATALCRDVPTSSAPAFSVRRPCWPAITAGLFMGVSPPAVYYSRYFIQETLLVTFTLATIMYAQRAWRTRSLSATIAAGICIGLMQATKASAPLFLVAALLAALITMRRTHVRGPNASGRPWFWWRQFAIAMVAAFITAALLYSSFGTNPGGLRDAFTVYAEALTRFGTEAPLTGHEKPWWYYLRIFGWYRDGGLFWHQAPFSALAIAGFVVALARRDSFLRGVALYTLMIVGAFSFFAYKTPWHVVHFVPGMAVLGAGALVAIARLRTGRLVAVAFSLVVAATLYQQTGRAAFLRPGDQRNPYAYVHSSADILKYRALAEAAATRSPGEPIRVISEEYWPLPWYLRGIPRVGFYSTPPENCDGALVIVSASQADAVRTKLRGNYRESFLGLRPGFACILFTPES